VPTEPRLQIQRILKVGLVQQSERKKNGQRIKEGKRILIVTVRSPEKKKEVKKA
jgi:hypothetical protein